MNKPASLHDQWVNASPERRRVYAQERLIVEVQEEIFSLMEREQLSKEQLAKRLGCSKAHVSQLLNSSRNMTLRTLADVAHVLGHHVAVSFTHAAPIVAYQSQDGDRSDG